MKKPEEMDKKEFSEIKAAIHHAREQAGRGEGISLEEFDRNMRARYGMPGYANTKRRMCIATTRIPILSYGWV